MSGAPEPLPKTMAVTNSNPGKFDTEWMKFKSLCFGAHVHIDELMLNIYV